MDHNPWVIYDPMSDRPVNWRHMMAIRLRDVEIEPIIPAVCTLLAGMIEMTNAKVLWESPPAHDKAAVLQFSYWQEPWLEHFGHRFDPIRNLFELLILTFG